MKNIQQYKRKFLQDLSKGLITGAGIILLPSEGMANSSPDSIVLKTYAMWVHGSQGKIEGAAHSGKNSSNFYNKMFNTLKRMSSEGYCRSNNVSSMAGTTIALSGEVAATLVPTSGGGVFTIWDRGTKSKPRNGEFWVHYAVPTGAIINGVRSKVTRVLVKCVSSDQNFHITDVELWDGNTRIYNKPGQKLWGRDEQYGFTFGTPHTVRHGLCISLRIKGEYIAAEKS